MTDRQRKTVIKPGSDKNQLKKKDWMTVMSGRNISFKVLFVSDLPMLSLLTPNTGWFQKECW